MSFFKIPDVHAEFQRVHVEADDFLFNSAGQVVAAIYFSPIGIAQNQEIDILMMLQQRQHLADDTERDLSSTEESKH